MISWDRVGQLKEEMGPDGFSELITIFLEEADDVSEKLASEEDSPTLVDRLHFLKGCAANIGFVRVEELCNRAEFAARDGNFAIIDVREILTSYAESRKLFLEGMSETAS